MLHQYPPPPLHQSTNHSPYYTTNTTNYDATNHQLKLLQTSHNQNLTKPPNYYLLNTKLLDPPNHYTNQIYHNNFLPNYSTTPTDYFT